MMCFIDLVFLMPLCNNGQNTGVFAFTDRGNVEHVSSTAVFHSIYNNLSCLHINFIFSLVRAEVINEMFLVFFFFLIFYLYITKINFGTLFVIFCFSVTFLSVTGGIIYNGVLTHSIVCLFHAETNGHSIQRRRNFVQRLQPFSTVTLCTTDVKHNHN